MYAKKYRCEGQITFNCLDKCSLSVNALPDVQQAGIIANLSKKTNTRGLQLVGTVIS